MLRDTLSKDGTRPLYNVPPGWAKPQLLELKARLDHLVDPLLGPGVHGWRRGHSVATAVERIASMPDPRISCDIVSYFSCIEQDRLARMVRRLDPHLWHDLEPWMPPGGIGVPEGCACSPSLANLYLTDVDNRWPELTRYGDNVILSGPRVHRKLPALRCQLLNIGLLLHDVVVGPESFCGQVLPTPIREVDPSPMG